MPQPTPTPTTQPAPRPQQTSGASSSSIGPSLVILGELSGQEDLTINGRVEGKVELKQNSVTVGRTGQVKADIVGQTIRVEGQVQGNLFGATDVVITKTGSVRGNLVAPRVVLENGSKFKGSIDMEPEVKKAAPAAAVAAPAATTAKPMERPGSSSDPGKGSSNAPKSDKPGQMGLGSPSGASRG